MIQRMSRKSGTRFSDKDMRKQKILREILILKCEKKLLAATLDV